MSDWKYDILEFNVRTRTSCVYATYDNMGYAQSKVNELNSKQEGFVPNFIYTVSCRHKGEPSLL